MPIVVALLSIIGGVWGYASQKKMDRKSALNRTQQAYYRDYLFAMQRVLTSCVRTDHDARRASIDEFRSYEAALYVSAPHSVAKNLAPLHAAFFDYTRCIRCKYEPKHFDKFGSDYPIEQLMSFEKAFKGEYQSMLQKMRRATLSDDSEIRVGLSLASKESHK